MKKYCDNCGIRLGRWVMFILIPVFDTACYEYKNKDGSISKYCYSCMKKREKDV